MEEPELHIAKWKQSIWKATYSVIPATWHSGKGKTIEIALKKKKKRSVGGGRKKEKDEWVEHRGFFRVANYFVWYCFFFFFSDTAFVDTWHYAFVKTCKMVQYKDWA